MATLLVRGLGWSGLLLGVSIVFRRRQNRRERPPSDGFDGEPAAEDITASENKNDAAQAGVERPSTEHPVTA